MARRKKPGAQLIYSAAEAFVERALREHDSLFTPGIQIWSKPVVDDLHARFVQRPNEDPNLDFKEKFEGQLRGAPASTCQLAAECLYVYFLIDGHTGRAAKTNLIRLVLSWNSGSSLVQIPKELDDVLAFGLVNPGPAHHIARPSHLWLLIEFAKAWKALPPAEVHRLLGDPFAVKDMLRTFDIPFSQPFREGLLHLLFPDTFEAIVSRDQKDQIVAAWSRFVSPTTTDRDRKLMEVRTGLSQELGRDFDFYEDDVWPQWSKAKQRKRIVGGRVSTDPSVWIFQGNPDLYDIRGALRDLREMTWLVRQHAALIHVGDLVYIWEAGGDGILATATVLTEPTIMTEDEAARSYIREPDKFAGSQLRVRLRLQEVLREPITRDELRTLPELSSLSILAAPQGSNFAVTSTQAKALEELVRPRQQRYFVLSQKSEGSSSYKKDEEGKQYHFDTDVPGQVQLRSARSGRFVYYRPQSGAIDDSGGTFFGAGNIDSVDVDPDGTEKNYLAQLSGYSRLPRPVPRSEFSPTGWTPRSSVVSISRSDFEELLRRGGVIKGQPERVEEQLDCAIDETDPVLAQVQALLEDGFGGVILCGPPGTSKTWYAAQIAAWLADRKPMRVRSIQFHASYQYEDFVEGFRPSPLGGFELAPKHLLELCEAARLDPQHTYILLIDELSRSDPARVFGEALTYLEVSRRGKPFALASGRQTDIPGNLVILATMNSFDRGVSEVDAAFERRFGRIDMLPSPERLRSLMEQNGASEEVIAAAARFFGWLQKNGNDFARVGHAYFVNVSDEESLQRLWDHQLRFVMEKAYRLEPDILRTVVDAWAREARVIALDEQPTGPTVATGAGSGPPSTEPA
jgi:5-methylcytosine-specific restriction protein B